jgi:hypothetical protein
MRIATALFFILSTAVACGDGDAGSGGSDSGGGSPTGPGATGPGATTTGSTSSSSNSSTGVGGSPIPEGAGWMELPDTQLETICPDPSILGGGGPCSSVVSAWGGGAADTTLNRLIVWGGGHNDWGNEVYVLDLSTLTIGLLTQPSVPNLCEEANADGTANSRHSYEALEFVPTQNAMYVFGGAIACPEGGGTGDTWLFDLGTATWNRKDPVGGGTGPNPFIGATGYDAGRDRVLVHDTQGLYAYHASTNTYSSIDEDASTNYHMSGEYDPGRDVFVLAGGGEYHVFNLADGSSHEMQSPQYDASCSPIVDAAYPGLAYDPISQRVVGWAGGDTVYLLDASTHSCTPLTFPDGPGPQQMNGTNGRFRYFPAYDAFALVNDMSQNAFVLQLNGDR